ncbi:MAG: aconitase X [Methanomassiliicoccus sp.]|nr:aconitase X [Methanomassiliicoccus sp.]
MILGKEQELALSGRRGPAVEWAMGHLVKLGDREGSSRLIPVRSVHLPNWCTVDSPEAWKWLCSLTGKIALPFTANPRGPGDIVAEERKRLLEGWRLQSNYSFTCTPYLSGNHPSRDQVIAWGGRAASSFANSILGARTEVESFETAVASAITGLTPERGLHLEENRQATVAVTVPKGGGTIDYPLLGWTLSRELSGEIPLLCGVAPTFDEAKRLALAMNALAEIPLFRMQRGSVPPAGMQMMEVGKDSLSTNDLGSPDLIILGCPHMSEQDINRWSKKLADRAPSNIEAWFFTSRLCLDKCPIFGDVLRKRGHVFVDECPLGMREELVGRAIACDSPSLVECLRNSGLRASYRSEAEMHQLLTI